MPHHGCRDRTPDRDRLACSDSATGQASKCQPVNVTVDQPVGLYNFQYVNQWRLSVCQVRTAVSKTLVGLFENDILGALLEDAPAQKDAYNRLVRCKRQVSK